MKSLSHTYLNSLTFEAVDVSTLRSIGECKGQQELFTYQKPEVLRALSTNANIQSTESSNRIEGIVAPRSRIQALVKNSSSPRNRNEQEIAGYRDALYLIHDSAIDIPLTANVFLQLHGMIYKHQAASGGHWKLTDNRIVERSQDGEIKSRFEPLPAVATPQAMEDLVALYARGIAEQVHDPMVLIPLTILDFLCIHPFADGNGRISRLLSLLLLYQNGYEVGRFISLERVIEGSRETYYEALAASSSGWHQATHDVRPWLRYFWGIVLAAYRDFEQRVGEVGGGRGSKSRQVRSAIDRRIAPFSISDLERDCPGISRETVRNVLRTLRSEGALELHGRGRGARWHKTRSLTSG